MVALAWTAHNFCHVDLFGSTGRKLGARGIHQSLISMTTVETNNAGIVITVLNLASLALLDLTTRGSIVCISVLSLVAKR